MPDTKNVLDKGVCVVIQIGRLGTRRKVQTSQVEVDADVELIHVGKDILVSDELKAISKLDGELRRYVKSRCLPSPLFKGGVHLLPIVLVEEVDAKLEEFRVQRDALIETFIGAYPKLVDAARDGLKGLFTETDYPPVSRLVREFSLSVNYMTFGVPGSLESISKTIFAREREKAEAQITEATQQIIQVLRLNMLELTEHMVDRLTPEGDGKKRVFKNSLVENMRDFLDTFRARNLADDTELDALVNKAQKILSGVDPQMLRDDASMRTYVATAMSEIKTSLDGMVTTRDRKVRDADEEDPGAAAA